MISDLPVAYEPAMRERLVELAAAHGGQKGLARLAGVTESTLSRILHGGGGNLDTFVKIAVATGRSLDWLTLGGDDVARPALPDRKITQGMAVAYSGQLIAGDYALVPRYDIRASDGAGALVESENIIERVAYRMDWIRATRLDPDKLMCAQADGDSMEPTISDGDLLLIDTRVTHPRSEGIYFMRFGDGLVVKRLQLRPDGGANLISDNAARYEPQRLSREELGELQILGRVRWRGGRV